MPKQQSPAWIGRIASELQVKRAAGDTSAEALEFRAREVRERGPAVFKHLLEHARQACWALGFQWYAAANWFTVQDTGLPFRELRAVLDQKQLGIALFYTLGAIVGGRNPAETKDFIELRLKPPENFLELVHQGVPVQPVEALEEIFRLAFVPKG